MSSAIEPAKSAIQEYQLSMTNEELKDIILANLGDQGVTIGHLDKIVNPSAKSTKWEIPTLDGGTETTSEIEGIIVFHKLSRARWEGEYKGGGDAPLCTSKDGFHGEGDPGGECQQCPYAKFTEDSKGESQRPECRLVKQVFIRRPGDFLPTTLNVSAINIHNIDRYLSRLLSKGKMHNSVVTKVSLTTDKSKSGYDYPRMNFAATEILSPEQAKDMNNYTQLIKPMLLEIRMDESDVEETTEPDW